VRQEAIVRVLIKINGDVFFKGGLQFCFQGTDEVRDPMLALVIFLAIRDKDIVFEVG